MPDIIQSGLLDCMRTFIEKGSRADGGIGLKDHRTRRPSPGRLLSLLGAAVPG